MVARRYIQALTNNVTFVRYKELYAAAAEIIGLMLKNLTHATEVGASPVSPVALSNIALKAPSTPPCDLLVHNKLGYVEQK